MIFNDTWFLLILLTIPVIIHFYRKRTFTTSIKFSDISNLKKLKPSIMFRMRYILIILRLAAIFLLVLGLARPQKGVENSKITTEGIDIMLAIDVSGSMRAMDFTINNKRTDRLEVVKQVVHDFITRRVNDRIGMIVFARYAYTQCPLTLDYGVLLQFLDKVQIVDRQEEDGTAIGSAIAQSVKRLKDTESKSKVLILLTDGMNNIYDIDPQTATEIAKTLGVKIYTVGVGTHGEVPYPMTDMLGRQVLRPVRIDIDENSLKEIASNTGGMYFRATDTRSLEKIYEQIDKLEKTETKSNIYMEYNEAFAYFVLPALGFLLLEIVLANTRFRKIP
ncbi:MAG: VWA domain-containing protein [Candidatus Auribacterota bacterium]|jgi:Ca-activated chloride channel family protein|nr:VWA domain-containing protein [Candidatus Auribacterota bacterium]